MTKAQDKDIMSKTGMSARYLESFDSSWGGAVGRLRGSGADLSRIRLVPGDGGREKTLRRTRGYGK